MGDHLSPVPKLLIILGCSQHSARKYEDHLLMSFHWLEVFLCEAFDGVGRGYRRLLPPLPHSKSPVNHIFPKKTQPLAIIVISNYLTSVRQEKCYLWHHRFRGLCWMKTSTLFSFCGIGRKRQGVHRVDSNNIHRTTCCLIQTYVKFSFSFVHFWH